MFMSDSAREQDRKAKRRLRDARIAARAGNRGAIKFMQTFGERWLRDLEARDAVRESLDRAMTQARGQR